jgi:hypothetical protein
MSNIRTTKKLLEQNSLKIASGNAQSRPSDNVKSYVAAAGIKTQISDNALRLSSIDSKLSVLSENEIRATQLQGSLQELSSVVSQTSGVALGDKDLAIIEAAFNVQADAVLTQADAMSSKDGMSSVGSIKDYIEQLKAAFQRKDKSAIMSAASGINSGMGVVSTIISRIGVEQSKLESERVTLQSKDVGNYQQYGQVADTNYIIEGTKNQVLTAQVSASYITIDKLAKLSLFDLLKN